MIRLLFVATLFALSPASGTAAELSPAERGKKALLETSFIPPIWRKSAYENVWKQWGPKEKPADLEKAVRERFGLHSAPYPNGGLPMGLRKSNFLVVNGVSLDCLACHGGSILGKSYVGLGNSTLDVQALFEDLSAADGRSRKLPLTFSNVRGTSEAGGFAVYLLAFRNPDLSLRSKKDLGLHDDMCEDVPAWWLLKKKRTMYHTGGTDARSVRSKMQFMMTPLTTRADFDRHERTFEDIEAYVRTLEAPKYPYPIHRDLASRGKKLFAKNCASCHGTYGENWTYPNKIVPIEEIGTDPKRYEGITQAFGDEYNRSWFAREHDGWFTHGYEVTPTKGYQAPPLDGLWATAPYFHNGSAPTVYHVLKSDARPQVYTRSFQTGAEDYDPKRLGWKFTEVERDAFKKADPYERRKFYDTKQSGRGNGGHTYGDKLTEEQRWAVIEYLKTL
jgi:mono/diheme cytochrome c family protein